MQLNVHVCQTTDGHTDIQQKYRILTTIIWQGIKSKCVIKLPYLVKKKCKIKA